MIARRDKLAALHNTAAMTVLLFLTACGANYQAPISEQGERQRVVAPLIVDSSTGDSSFRTPTSRAATVSASSPAVTSSSNSGGNRVQADTAAPRSHRVSSGETLFSIAYQYDLDFRSLALANGLNPPYTIFVDQRLNLSLGSNGATQARSSVGITAGTAVANSSVARTRAGNSNSGRVLRQPVSSSSVARVNWQWPHPGRTLRGFQAGLSKGIDIGGNRGEAVLAAADGDVVYSGRDIQGTGDLIIIRHSDRYLSAYAHNSVMLVSEGSRVRAGEKIAEIGESDAGIAMLHFEIREDGKSIDPSRLLPAR